MFASALASPTAKSAKKPASLLRKKVMPKPTLASIPAELGKPGRVLTDSAFYSEAAART